MTKENKEFVGGDNPIIDNNEEKDDINRKYSKNDLSLIHVKLSSLAHKNLSLIKERFNIKTLSQTINYLIDFYNHHKSFVEYKPKTDIFEEIRKSIDK